VPRTLWRLRRTADSPRPAGRRWSGRWRRGGFLARRVLRGRRRRPDGALAVEAYHPRSPHAVRPVDPYGPHLASPTTLAGAGAGVAGYAGAGNYSGGGSVAGREPDLLTAGAPSLAAAADTSAPLLPGARTVGRQMRFALVNLCTIGSLALGILAILLAMRGDVQLAALCLIACVVCDGLDGFLARRLGVSSPFGAQMDSLADMCAFGVAAPVVLYASLAGTVPPAAAALACAMVAACAAVRLARFNVSAKDGRFFTGVPTTAVAGVLACAVLIELPLPPAAQLVGLALLAFAMVSSFPYATLTRLMRMPAWFWLAPVAGALVNAQLTFVLLVALYLASGPLLWLHHRRRPA
jgi:CDP-diacylglycerol---serine O-phosphatidyltransferase